MALMVFPETEPSNGDEEGISSTFANNDERAEVNPALRYSATDPSPPGLLDKAADEESPSLKPEDLTEPPRHALVIRNDRRILWDLMQEAVAEQGTTPSIHNVSRVVGLARDTLRAYRNAAPGDRWPIFSDRVARQVCEAFDWDREALHDLVVDELESVARINRYLARLAQFVNGVERENLELRQLDESLRATAEKVRRRTDELRKAAERPLSE